MCPIDMSLLPPIIVLSACEPRLSAVLVNAHAHRFSARKIFHLLQLIKEENPENLEQLVRLAKANVSLQEYNASEQILRLIAQGKTQERTINSLRDEDFQTYVPNERLARNVWL